MAEITITIKIDGNGVTVAQDSQPGVRVIQTESQPQAADVYSLVAKRRLPRAYDDQKGGQGPGDTTT